MRKHVSIPAVLLVLGLAACAPSTTDTPSPGGNGGSSGSTTTAAGNSGVTGEAAGANGDPCLLITADDIKAAVNETVSATKRLAPHTDADDGTTSQQCVFLTSGPPMSGAGIKALGQVAAGLGGGDPNSAPDTAGSGAIGITISNLEKPVVGDEMDGEALPPGGKVLQIPGALAVVMPSRAGGQGGAAFGGKGSKGVIVMDLEGRTVTADELEKLVRAALARL